MANLFKNRLQNYAQKRNLPLPSYSCVMDGPPHSRRFKAMVTIDGQTYEGPEFFGTLKDAEHAAAKVAFESLSSNDVPEDDGLSKSLLQEFAQRLGFRFPVYATVKSGPPHMPTFVSTVEIEGETFQGQEAKTKKQAEMNAAKIAYAGLTEGRARTNGAAVSLVCHIMEDFELPSSSLQTPMTNELQPKLITKTDEMQLGRFKANLSTEKEQAESDEGQAKVNIKAISCGSDAKGALEDSSSSLRRVVSQKLQPNVTEGKPLHVKPKNHLIKEDQAEKDEDINARRYRYSSADNGPSSLGHSTDSVLQSRTAGPTYQKILVRPQKRNMTYADGAVVANGDKWVAMRVNAD